MCKNTKRILRTASLSAWFLMPAVCQAGIIYVDDSSDSGSSSLRQAITTSNGDGTDTSISWRYAGGTVPLASSLPNINWVTTLDFTDAVSAVTLYSSDDSYTLGLGGTVTIKNDNTAAPLTLAVIITSCGDPYWEVNCAKGGDLQSGESRCASVAQQIRKNGVV